MRSISADLESRKADLSQVRDQLFLVNGILDQPDLEDRAIQVSRRKSLEEQRESLLAEIERLVAIV